MNLWRVFTVNAKVTTADTRRRAISTYSPANPPITLRGILAASSMREQLRWKQLQHPVTHTIAQQGPAVAQPGDLLTLDDGRKFYVQSLENPGDLGIWVLYHVEQRFDV